MKMAKVLLALGCAVAGVGLAGAEESSPLRKVVELLSGLQQNVIGQGEEAQKIYHEFAEACEDRARELHHEIKTTKAKVEELKAIINEETAKDMAMTSKIEELASSQADDEAELKAATELREKEAKLFKEAEKELLEMLDALRRASAIIERQSGASLAQLAGAKGTVQVLQAMVEASAINSADASRLTALVQSGSSSDDAGSDSMDDTGAPAAEAYESKNGAVSDVLEGLTEKAEDELDSLRKQETQALHNYELKKQALEDQIKSNKKDMEAAKKELASAGERKAGAEGDMQSTSKDLQADIESLAELHHECMEKAASFEEETTARGEELKALATAKKAIVEMTGGAEKEAYGLAQQDSFVQLKATTRAKSADGSPGVRAIHLVRRLAMASQSAELAQLASRMGAAMRAQRRSGEDPFEKVKGLISDMIDKLEEAAGQDAKKKAWCDKETAQTSDKREDIEDEIEKMTTKIDQMTAESVKLKEEVGVLQKELGALTKYQAEADRVRAEEKAEFDRVKPQLEQGLEGVKTALKILREYYSKAEDDGAAHDAQSGGATGIIGMLEVVESDFSKELADVVAEEERAASEHDVVTKMNEIEKAAKETDMKFKVKEYTSLDKAVAENGGDLSSTKEEQAAILQYWDQIQKACSARAEPFEERAKARAKEIEGLKEALDALESETAFVQRRVTRRTLRGGGQLHPAH